LCENAKSQERQAGRSYAQAVSSNNEQAQDVLEESTFSQTLLKIMTKLDQQEGLNRAILERVTKLENDSKWRAISNSKTNGGGGGDA
jgi:short subunit fatty acids transporter